MNINTSNNNTSLPTRVSPKKIKPTPLHTDIKPDESLDNDNDNENILMTSPLYRKRMESFNSETPNSRKESYTYSKKSSRSSVPAFNISIKDLKNKFESNQQLSNIPQDQIISSQVVSLKSENIEVIIININ